MKGAYQIEVKVRFRAGHRLIEPYRGKCNNPHGEGYTAIFVFGTDEVDDRGMVYDFGYVKEKLNKWIKENLDHAYIYCKDDKVGNYMKSQGFRTYEMDDNPTAENICKLLYNRFESLFENLMKVGLIESFDDNIAWYWRME